MYRSLYSLYTLTHSVSRKFPFSFLYFSFFFFKKEEEEEGRKDLLGFLGTDLLAQQCPDEGKRMLP